MSRRASVDDDAPPTDPDVLNEYITTLTTTDALSAIGYELEALVSIYPDSLRLLPSSQPGSRVSSPAPVPPPASPTERIRYELALPAWEDEDAPRIRVAVSLPPGYPQVPPQLTLLGRYVGAFPIDAGLFGEITRTYITSSGVAHTPGEVCVFDGLVHVQELVAAWHAARVAEGAEGEARRHADSGPGSASASGSASRPTSRAQAEDAMSRLSLNPTSSNPTTISNSTTVHSKPNPTRPLPTIYTSTAITDRKSAFVGHAARITHEADVAAVVAHLLEDKRVARAAHPAILAYRVVREVGGAAGRVVESDYDDDGETQAGARLKHLVEILELENVLVVVTRWFGGIHLGPDRFKHINQAARDALALAGLLEEPKDGRRRRK